MTAVNSISLLKTSLQQLGTFLASCPSLATSYYKTYIHPGSCDVTNLFISITRNKKGQSDN